MCLKVSFKRAVCYTAIKGGNMKKINLSFFTKIVTVSLFCCLLGSIAYAQNLPVTGKERSARIDIYSEGRKFDLTGIKSNGRAWQPLAGGQKNQWWIAELALNGENKWQELWIEFTPVASGFVFVELRGSNYPDLKTNHHEVYFDDMKIEGEGVEIKNPSFEKVDLKGNPVDWGYTSSSKDMCNRSGIEAHAGKSCVLVWHDSPVIQRVAVKAGNQYKVSAWAKPTK